MHQSAAEALELDSSRIRAAVGRAFEYSYGAGRRSGKKAERNET